MQRVSENWKIQVSPKLADGTLINLRAENPAEAEAILTWATKNANLITDTAGAFVGTANVVQAFPGSQVVDTAGPSWSQQGSQQTVTNGPPQQQPPGQNCAHGAMVFRSGIGKASGKPYKAFFCPAPKGTPNQCDAVFVRD